MEGQIEKTVVLLVSIVLVVIVLAKFSGVTDDVLLSSDTSAPGYGAYTTMTATIWDSLVLMGVVALFAVVLLLRGELKV